MEAKIERHGEGGGGQKLQNAVFEIWNWMILYGREELQGVLVRAVVNLLPFGHPFRSAEKITRPPGEQLANQKKTENPARDGNERFVLRTERDEWKAHGEGVKAGFGDAFGRFVMANVVEGEEIEIGGHLMIGEVKGV